MKHLFLLILLSAASFSVFSQVSNQIQAKRGVFTEQLYLNGKWINGISTDMYTADSSSDDVVPTAKAIADYIRNKATTPTFQDVLNAGSTLTKTNIINAGNNLFVWNNNLANNNLFRFRIDNSNSQITRTLYGPDFNTISDFIQSPNSNWLYTSGTKVGNSFVQNRDAGTLLISGANFTNTQSSLMIDSAKLEFASGNPNVAFKQHKIYVRPDSIAIGSYSHKFDGTEFISVTNLFLRGLPTSTSYSDSVLVKMTDGRIGYRATDAAAGGAWTTSESNIYNSNTGNVAIGINNPTAKFHVQSREFGTEGVTAYINPIWNTSGNPTAFKVNPQVIGNGGSSLLADFQYSGTSRLSIRHDGQLTLSGYSGGTITGTPAYDLQTTNSGTVIQKVAPKVYTALLSQTGANAPVATVLGTNSLGAITWTRNSAGAYTGTLTGAFPVGKTFVVIGSANDFTDNAFHTVAFRANDNEISLEMLNVQNVYTDEFNYVSIEIRVYP